MFRSLKDRAYSLWMALHLAYYFGVNDLLPSLPRGDEGYIGGLLGIAFGPLVLLILVFILFL